MNLIQTAALVLGLCSLGGYINQKTVNWPPVLAMTLTSIAVVLGLQGLAQIGLIPLDRVEAFVHRLNFADLVLHGLLALLLFAGALFVDVGALRRWAKPIGSLITLGVLLSTLTVGVLLWWVAPHFGIPLGFWWCVLFGALIAPTDPIAALAIVRRAGAPKQLEIKLVGESLFNDGTGVMLFLVVLGILQTGDVSPRTLIHEVFVAPAGAVALGLIGGFMTTGALKRVDHHPTEILMTLTLACGVYGLAEAIHVSAPIAVVVAGLVIGHRARTHAMSASTREHLDSFWEGIDEMLNAILFALIGLELLVIDVPPETIGLGVVAWLLVLVGRWVGVAGALRPVRQGLGKGTTKVLVWGGLRGGISLALALSVPPGREASVLVAVTFIVVALSAVVQGLTLGRVLPPQGLDEPTEEDRSASQSDLSDGDDPQERRLP